VRVVIDARSAVSREPTGVGHYTTHLIDLLPRVDPGTTYMAWYPSLGPGLRVKGSDELSKRDRPPNLVERRMPIPPPLFERLSLRFGVPRVEWMMRFDVLLAPNFIPPATRALGLVVTVHDLAFQLFPPAGPPVAVRRLSRLRRAVCGASRVIAVSEQTRHDVLQIYPVQADRVSVVPLGVDPEVFRPAPERAVTAVRHAYRIQGPYLLALGGLERRKNLPALVRAYASLDTDVRPSLVLAGPTVPWDREEREVLLSALDDLPTGIREGVVLTGYVPESDKVALLSGAEALVYPSLYEGFGLPVIEAMACGTPVLTSNVSALPATAGDAALLVDPRDEEAIAAGIERLLTDSSLRERLRRTGMERSERFTWRETALQTAEILHQTGG
jgi:glycosyltransferase involved in cell wall biosynthesis